MTVFLEHKNSEPAMKILMRNIGMTLHVIHTLRKQGIDNVQVNMDWQHLIMNGENLAEYAALLAAEGLLGHQHANSGWGTFDDDNMVGATAFMETIELAIELRRAGYGAKRRTARLRPLPLHRRRRRRRQTLSPPLELHRQIAHEDRRARTPAGPTQQRRRPRLRTRLRRTRRLTGAAVSQDVLVGLDVGTTGVKAIAISPDGRVLASASEEYPLSTPQPGWAEQDPEDWWRAAQACLARLPQGPVGLSGQMHGLVVLDADDRVLRPAILWNDQRTAAECAEIEARVGLDRLIELTGNRALTGFTAPKLLWLRRHEPETYARIRHVLLPKDYVRLRLTGEHAIDAADASGTLLFDVAGGAGRRRSATRSTSRSSGCRPRTSRPRSPAPATRRRPRSASGSSRPGPVSVVLGTSGVVFAALPAYAPRRAGAPACLLPRGARHVARDGRDAERGRVARLAAPASSAREYGVLDEEAARWAPGAEGLLFAPYLAGERTPHADPDARGAFTGLSLRHDRGALARATLEGVAYGLRDSLELLRELGAQPGGRARVGRRRAERPLAAHRRVGARAAARADRVGGGLRVRRRAPRRRSRRRLRGRRRRRRALRARARADRAGSRSGRPPTSAATSGSGLLYPALKPLEET